MSHVTINEGTSSNIATDLVGTLNYQIIKFDIGAAGASSLFTGTIPAVSTIGTLQAGTVTVTNPTGTTVQFNNGTVDLLKAGTITKLEGGTVQTNILTGTVTRISTIGTLEVGTISTLPNLPQGSINVTAGTITAGSIRITTGTIGGAAGTATALSGNPVPVSGVDAGGTVYGLLVDAKGQQLIGGGTISMLNAATISALPNIPGGTITRISTIGTLEVGTISTLPNLPQGSINVTAGTITSGSVRITVGTINAGTVGGAGGTAAALSGNPVPVGGVDSGGTLYGFLVDAKGQQLIGGGTISMLNAGTISVLPNLPGGTITRVSTIGTLEVGTISTLPNLPQGSINVTAGTITAGSIRITVGTVGGAAATAVALSGNPVPVAGVDSGGTIYGFLVDAKGQQLIGGGTISMLNAATISTLPNIPGGTITRVSTIGTLEVGTISTLPNLPQGSINVTAGTITAGTFRDDGRCARNILTFGTQVSGTAAIAATIVGSASVGAGTSMWMQDISILNPYGSVLCVAGFGTTQQGTNVIYRGVLGTQTSIGIEKSYAKAVNAGMTNQDFVVSLGAAGTIDVSLSYFISA